jgi:predicted DNA-binding protein (MmcQ/YjbR family)
MARSSPLSEMRRICLSLPEATETMTWGQPHFRVRGKIFAGIGDHAGIENIGFKLEREHADAVIQDPRFYRAPYVGAHGWVSMRIEGIRDWDEVRALLLESYRLIAPKTLWAVVQGKAPAKAGKARPARSTAPRRGKPAAKKTRRAAKR